MTKHTPGPIKRDPENWMSVIDETDHWTKRLICQFNGKERAEAEANADRMVATWNACTGIPTPALKEGAVKELVGALENLLGFGTGGQSMESMQAIDEARAAVAEFKEEG